MKFPFPKYFPRVGLELIQGDPGTQGTPSSVKTKHFKYNGVPQELNYDGWSSTFHILKLRRAELHQNFHPVTFIK